MMTPNIEVSPPPRKSVAQGETQPNPRQQDKIIKVVVAGSLSTLNEPATQVSDTEREAFRGQVLRGGLDGGILDEKVIKHIAAPFSDGAQSLYEQLKREPRQLKEIGALIRTSLYDKNAVYIDGWQPTADELQRFVHMYPTPYAFDKTFVSGRRQELEMALGKESVELRKQALQMEMSLLKQKEARTYPILRAMLYGKRNEYWEQCKLLLQASGKNSVEPTVDSIVEAPPASLGTEQAEPKMERPEPKKEQEAERTETREVLPTRDQFIASSMAYQDDDAGLPEDTKRRALDWAINSDSAKRYADALLQLAAEQRLEEIRRRATEMRDTMLKEATRLGISSSPYGKSATWAMWDIGKQYYFASHPEFHQDQISHGYEIGNPMESKTKQEEIIARHLGWEAYAEFNNPKSTAAWKQEVREGGKYAKARALLAAKPKENNTLSSRDLAELGKLLREA